MTASPPNTPMASMPSAKAARAWLAVLLFAMGLEAVALAFFTPATFMLFAVVAVPLGLAAAAFFAVRAIRALARGGIL